MSEAAKAWDGGFGSAKLPVRQTRAPNADFGLLKNASDLLKWKELSGCDMEAVSRKVANTEKDMSGLFDALSLGTFKS